MTAHFSKRAWMAFFLSIYKNFEIVVVDDGSTDDSGF